MDYFRDLGTRRGLTGFSPTDLSASFVIAQMATVRSCWDLVNDGNHPEMLQLTTWAAREVPRAQQVTILAHSTARYRSGDRRAIHRLLFTDLLAGRPAAAAAAAAGVSLPASYLLVLCSAAQPTLIRVGDGRAPKAVPRLLIMVCPRRRPRCRCGGAGLGWRRTVRGAGGGATAAANTTNRRTHRTPTNRTVDTFTDTFVPISRAPFTSSG